MTQTEGLKLVLEDSPLDAIQLAFYDGYIAGVYAERKACAMVCDDLADKDKLSNYYPVAANAIRARSNT